MVYDLLLKKIQSLETKLDALTENYEKTKKSTCEYQEHLAEEVLGIHEQIIHNIFWRLENELKVLTDNYENYKNSMHERLNIIERGIHPPIPPQTPICHLPHCPYCRRPGRTYA